MNGRKMKTGPAFAAVAMMLADDLGRLYEDEDGDDA